MEFLVLGGPQQAWRAIVTGPGMRSGFTAIAVDDMIAAQSHSISLGGGYGGAITVWAPPSRVGCVEPDWRSAGGQTRPAPAQADRSAAPGGAGVGGARETPPGTT
jgi:hypothetical protein